MSTSQFLFVDSTQSRVAAATPTLSLVSFGAGRRIPGIRLPSSVCFPSLYVIHSAISTVDIPFYLVLFSPPTLKGPICFEVSVLSLRDTLFGTRPRSCRSDGAGGESLPPFLVSPAPVPFFPGPHSGTPGPPLGRTD